jgi:ribosome maturation factor RimP
VDEIKKVTDALKQPLWEAGYELAGVSLSEGKDGLTLHIAVDREAPISLDDIVKVSDLINPLLDKADPIAGPYTLDVSSLGAEKPIRLERLAAYLGRYVSLHLTNPFQGRNVLEGTLRRVDEKTIALLITEKTRKQEILLPRSDVDKARLAIRF